MLDRKTLERLGAWQGYRLKDVIWPDGEKGTVELHLEPTRKVIFLGSGLDSCMEAESGW